MIRKRHRHQTAKESIPRESGDDPFTAVVADRLGSYSPRERG